MRHKKNCNPKVLMTASVASMIDQFNMSNICFLHRQGYQVYVACNFLEGNTCSPEHIRQFRRLLDHMQIVCCQWDCPRDIHPMRRCVKAYRQLRLLLEVNDFTWIHCQSPIGGALSRMAAGRADIPVIYTAHGFHFYRGAPVKNWLLFYPVEKLLSYRTDVLITVNKEDYRFAERYFRAGHPVYTPGIGVDTKKFRMYQDRLWQGESVQGSRAWFRKKYRIPDGAAVLLSVGELNAGKNHRLVIAALQKLQRQNVCYVICGQGELQQELQMYADRLGVGRFVRIAGFVEQLPYIYQNADIFVFPSVREGMPVALMEAMASGLPCVVSDIRGCRELIRGKGDGGFRFDLRQPEQLVKALNILLADASLRAACGKENQKKIWEYDQIFVQRRMRKIYKRMKMENERCEEPDKKA